MAHYEITGGQALHGTIKLSGAKNLASKLILASILTGEPCTLTNVPDIGESDIALSLIRAAGAMATRSGDTATITADNIHTYDLQAIATRNRLSILLIGPLLFRTGSADVPPVTGDQIGKRPIGFHIDALHALGVDIEQTEHGFRAVADRVHGATIALPYPSVGATETVLLTASWADGETVLTNAAIEPEVVALAHYLVAMGAKITIDIEQRCYRIQGVRSFHGASQRVIPDRLEAVSYASVALATGGDILLDDAQPADLQSYLDFCHRLGAGIELQHHGIRFFSNGPLVGTWFETAVHPGFMADWQQPSVVVLACATGTSRIHETVYEDRLRYTDELRRMGADIQVSTDCYGTPCRFMGQGHSHSATIHGPTTFQPATLTIPDIRAGMAHVVAALVAPGTSKLVGIEHLDRGYGLGLQIKLQGVGAVIERIED